MMYEFTELFAQSYERRQSTMYTEEAEEVSDDAYDI